MNAINIPAGITGQAGGGYVHDATGFVVHDIWSVADAIEANGALVYSVDTGAWRWVAGTDLHVFIKAFGVVSLTQLSTALMKPLVLSFSGVLAGGINPVGGGRQGMQFPGLLTWPGLSETAQTNLRVFGLVNNLQAGHGCSSDLCRVSFAGRNALSFLDAFVTKDPSVPGYVAGYAAMVTNEYSTGSSGPAPYNVNGGTTLAQSELHLGRGVIAVPMKTWATLYQQIIATTPHVDKSEVAERVNTSLLALKEIVDTGALGSIPSFRVPVIIGRSGKVYLDEVAQPGIWKTNTHIDVLYSPYKTVAVPYLNTGHWMTNPMALVKTAVATDWPAFRPSGASDLQTGPAMPALTPTLTGPDVSEIRRLDGVHISNILGGLTGLTVTETGVDYLTRNLLGNVMDYFCVDSAVSVQTGEETNEAYATRMTARYNNGVTEQANYLPNSWTFAGQPVLIATLVQNAALQDGGKLGPWNLALMASGYFSSTMRSSVDQTTANVNRKITASSLPALPAALTTMLPGPVF